MYVTPVDTSEICTIINGMKESSAGWDGIHAKIVKSTYNLYLDILTHVFTFIQFIHKQGDFSEGA